VGPDAVIIKGESSSLPKHNSFLTKWPTKLRPRNGRQKTRTEHYKNSEERNIVLFGIKVASYQ
jgi:hypothetical protein